ncbi:MAG: hypothetical protein GY773_00720, partial [Actinomycetia bacterium]|nr:hypothetical protein [Actinomycetes bacterium]
IVAEDFHVGEGETLAHNWKTFYFDLADGSHKLVATSEKGEAKLEHSFTKEGKRWAMLNYWFKPGGKGVGQPKMIKLDIRNEPINTR